MLLHEKIPALKTSALTLAASLVVTFCLFTIMALMIETAVNTINQKPQHKLADILMPERHIDTHFKQDKPEKPENLEPPPEAQVIELQPPQLDSENIKISAPIISLSGSPTLGLAGGEGDYLPIVKVQPIYPQRALNRGISGYVIVEFTVSKTGSIKDIVVIEAQPKGIFDRAAIKAAGKFKYKPRIVDGEAVEVTGVQNKITFRIEGN